MPFCVNYVLCFASYVAFSQLCSVVVYNIFFTPPLPSSSLLIPSPACVHPCWLVLVNALPSLSDSSKCPSIGAAGGVTEAQAGVQHSLLVPLRRGPHPSLLRLPQVLGGEQPCRGVRAAATDAD